MTAIYKFPTNWFSGMRLLQVNNDIRDLERKLSLLRKAIVEKDLPLKVHKHVLTRELVVWTWNWRMMNQCKGQSIKCYCFIEYIDLS